MKQSSTKMQPHRSLPSWLTRGAGPVRYQVGGGAPPASRRTLSPRAYTDPARFEAEWALLRRSWQVACHSSEVKAVGDTRLFEAFGETVAIVRQADGSLAAWHNVCQHRGTRLICETQHGARRFTCPYHHWVYDLDGTLIGVPGRENFSEDQLRGLRAPPVLVSERHGWIWVNLDANAEPLIDSLAEIDSELMPYRMSEATLLTPVLTFDIPSNWKRGVEAFIELYHAPFLHGQTIPQGSIDFGKTTYTLFERNSMFVYPPAETVKELEETLDHQRYGFCQYFAYPNVNFNMTSTSAQVYDFIPVTLNRTQMRLWLLGLPHHVSTPETLEVEVDYLQRVFGEDIFVCGEQSKTDRSAGNRRILLGDAECRIAHMFANLDRDTGQDSRASSESER